MRYPTAAMALTLLLAVTGCDRAKNADREHRMNDLGGVQTSQNQNSNDSSLPPNDRGTDKNTGYMSTTETSKQKLTPTTSSGSPDGGRVVTERSPSSEENNRISEEKKGDQGAAASDQAKVETKTQEAKNSSTVQKKAKQKPHELSPEERKAREGKKAETQPQTQNVPPATAPETTDQSQSQGQYAENPNVSEDSNSGLQASSEYSNEELGCSKKAHGPPLFLRQDIAYGITGIDCWGDLPMDGFTVDYDLPAGAKASNRAPASNNDSKQNCNESRHGHAKFLRSDIEYHLTGQDCQGDRPYTR